MTVIDRSQQKLDHWNAAYSSDYERRLQELKWAGETHKALCRRFGIEPSEEALEHLARRFFTPEWVRGSISLGDALVLYDVVRALRPGKIIEIGTASGCACAPMLFALEQVGAPLRDESGDPVVYTFDNKPHCYFAPDRAVGDGLRELAPDLMDAVEVCAGEWTAYARTRLEGADVGFAFIDGDHAHPFAAIDLLILAPTLAPGAWVALHDINLPEISRQYEERMGEKVNWSAVGPQALFENWPHEKIRPGKLCDNTGLIRMPTDRPVARADVEAALGVAWESEVPEHFLRFLDEA